MNPEISERKSRKRKRRGPGGKSSHLESQTSFFYNFFSSFEKKNKSRCDATKYCSRNEWFGDNREEHATRNDLYPLKQDADVQNWCPWNQTK